MATYSKKTLSGSTNGRAVLVSASIAGSAVTIHTGPSASTSFDEVWLYASNPDTSSHILTIMWGGTTNPNDYINAIVPAYSAVTLLSPGLIIQGNATPLVITAFADVSSKVAITGYVNGIV